MERAGDVKGVGRVTRQEWMEEEARPRRYLSCPQYVPRPGAAAVGVAEPVGQELHAVRAESDLVDENWGVMAGGQESSC